MKATIHGVPVEGTPDEIARLIELLDASRKLADAVPYIETTWEPPVDVPTKPWRIKRLPWEIDRPYVFDYATAASVPMTTFLHVN